MKDGIWIYSYSNSTYGFWHTKPDIHGNWDYTALVITYPNGHKLVSVLGGLGKTTLVWEGDHLPTLEEIKA